MRCGKALFALRCSVHKDLIEHIRDLEKPKEVWETLEKLFKKKKKSRLQMLENELANTTQGWVNQPTIVELENLLMNQEALVMPMAEFSISDKDEALFLKIKIVSVESGSKRISRNKVTKLGKGNAGTFKMEGKEEEKGHLQDWDTCLSATTLDASESIKVPVLTSIDKDNMGEGLAAISYEKDWIIDLGCSHHLTGDSSLFSQWNEYKGNKAIVTADNTIHPMVDEGCVKEKATEQETDVVTLNSVYHVSDMTKKLVSVSQISKSGKYVLLVQIMC
ncbi:hypothetical protein RJ639_007420 [Escallonia herrerae]|uniref:Retrovirus-related Pol polyprotein from transposon TNT 1-94-like beta-barrel domain-containing protein n=1 Tax=Escallonia herrerae TaxID=1293975 RepID=A0AA89AWY7_9ASTE|nr:hypothetical protein RJ639_007420 [Escallonia herrerae]